MIRGIFDLNTRIGIVYGLDVVITQDNGYGLLEPCTEVLYGMVPENQW
jgi:hypothetical protein